MNDEFTGSTDVLELDITPEKKTSRQLFATGDATDNYVIDRISTANRGYCSLLVTGSSPFDMEFNLDETCAVAKISRVYRGHTDGCCIKTSSKGRFLSNAERTYQSHQYART